jgi:peroxiredoxin
MEKLKTLKIIKKTLLGFLLLSALISCHKKPRVNQLKEGFWRAEIYMQNDTLPFVLKIFKDKERFKANLINAKEIIPLNEIQIDGDSVFIKLHIFDIDLRAKILNDSLSGFYIKNYKENYKIPFSAKYGKSARFDKQSTSTAFDGSWQITFKEEDGHTYPAVGLFKKEGNILSGTFLTETGDYRYLEGFNDDSKMTLYTFDGNHAFIFKATANKDSIKGTFLSGMSSKEQFMGINDANAKLTNANELTYLKKGYDKIEFSFPGLDGNQVTLEDLKYKNKVLLLQIFGTWCPNCMDETKFYADWYKKNKEKGVEIIGLAYEAKDNFNYAKTRIEKMKNKFNVDYDYVVAGVYDKTAAAKTLPMLNHVISFPTTIFIDRKGKVRRIHTGFSGPATGKYYTEFVKEFNDFMNKLLSEH